MIRKISSIKDLAVFHDFEWDKEVRDNAGNVIDCSRINIIYGRNYSGKTSLSRVFRAIETKHLSEKFQKSSFRIASTSGGDITEDNYMNSNEKIRVFNEDFVRENLRFINDPDDSVKSFAILGEHNNQIEREIKNLENELGSMDEGSETGLYAQQIKWENEISKINSEYQQKEKMLDEQLRKKAIDREIGIKYAPQRYDLNYNLPKLRANIEEVLSETYTPISNKQWKDYEKIIEERILEPVSVLQMIDLQFKSLSLETGSIVTKKIGKSNKIQELVENNLLELWVKDGRKHHKDKRDNCAFCGHYISEERWEELKRHFDEESEKFEEELDSLISKVSGELKKISSFKSSIQIDKSLFYSTFHENIDKVSSLIEKFLDKYLQSLQALANALEKRKSDIINPQSFQQPPDFSEQLEEQWNQYKNICDESNKYTHSIDLRKSEARSALLLNEVSNYLATIGYQEQIAAIQDVKDQLERYNQKKKITEDEIIEKEKLIKSMEQELTDEKKGAQKVNEYLNSFVDPRFLSLETKENDSDIIAENSQKIKFEVIRNGEKAYHLSEGECSLLAFCYFLAKLDEGSTGNLKPVIWIDDPVSSLDGNHIFFIYSLIASEIIFNKKFEQIFISTHNLEFLRYLSHLQGKSKKYFILVREGDNSAIQTMPKYLKEYFTEFNFLFHQIYKCSRGQTNDNGDQMTIYDFGNNARKFLEMYLYYKYPDQGMNDDTLQDFLGGKIPTLLTQRVTHEYSHLRGGFERGFTPIELPEMQAVARQIIEGVKKDKIQYISLLKSIGEIDENESS